MNIEIMELKKEHLEKYDVEKFLFKMVKESYDLDYVPEYHYDIKNLCKYYIDPERNNFYITIDKDNDKIIGSSGIRGYDKNYLIKNRNYNKNETASLYRLFVDKEYRHNKIATKMLKKIENFCREKEYNEIYLHTQKDSYGALPFWLSQEYIIVDDTHDEMGTVHMEKVVKNGLFKINSINAKEKILES